MPNRGLVEQLPHLRGVMRAQVVDDQNGIWLYLPEFWTPAPAQKDQHLVEVDVSMFIVAIKPFRRGARDG